MESDGRALHQHAPTARPGTAGRAGRFVARAAPGHARRSAGPRAHASDRSRGWSEVPRGTRLFDSIRLRTTRSAVRRERATAPHPAPFSRSSGRTTRSRCSSSWAAARAQDPLRHRPLRRGDDRPPRPPLRDPARGRGRRPRAPARAPAPPHARGAAHAHRRVEPDGCPSRRARARPRRGAGPANAGRSPARGRAHSPTASSRRAPTASPTACARPGWDATSPSPSACPARPSSWWPCSPSSRRAAPSPRPAYPPPASPSCWRTPAPRPHHHRGARAHAPARAPDRPPPRPGRDRARPLSRPRPGGGGAHGRPRLRHLHLRLHRDPEGRHGNPPRRRQQDPVDAGGVPVRAGRGVLSKDARELRRLRLGDLRPPRAVCCSSSSRTRTRRIPTGSSTRSSATA